MRNSVQGGASAVGRRGREEGERHFANREFAFSTLPGVERARVHAAIATCSESDYYVAAESARSASIIRVLLLVGEEKDIKDLFLSLTKPLLRFYYRGTIAERCGLFGRERIRR